MNAQVMAALDYEGLDFPYDHEKHVDHIVANDWSAHKRVVWSEDGRDVYVGRDRMFSISGQSEEGYIDEFHDKFALALYDEWGAFDCEGENDE